MEPDQFYTISGPGYAEFKDRGSKFLAYSFPVSVPGEFKEKLAELKAEHPKASHHCFAYRIGVNGTIFRSSDDREPSGSAGKPILGQLDSRGLTNTAIIVVRYFGGTLLGVPGLIHAYKTAAGLALDSVTIIQRPVERIFSLQFDYTMLDDVLKITRQAGATIIKLDLQLFCSLEIGIQLRKINETLDRFRKFPSIRVETKNL